MILARFRHALPLTLSVALLELTTASLVARLVAAPMERLTGAGDDPRRWLFGMMEEITHGRHRELGATLLLLSAFFVAYALLEPLLTIAFTRAHRVPEEATEPAYLRRVVALLLSRVLVATALLVTLTVVAGFGVLVHYATRTLPDPRLHDLSLLFLSGLPLAALPSAAAWFDLAAVRIALDEPRPLEASVDALHAVDVRVSTARAGLALASIGLVVLDASSAIRASAPGIALLLAFLATVFRLGTRSLYVAWLTERKARSVD